MVVESLEKLDELIALVELEPLSCSLGILETMKSWDDLFIQDYKYRNKGYSSTSFPSHLRHWLDLCMNLGQIDCRHVALLI